MPHVQSSQKWFAHGCEKFVPALAYLFCLALLGSCLARFTNLFWELCRVWSIFGQHTPSQVDANGSQANICSALESENPQQPKVGKVMDEKEGR